MHIAPGFLSPEVWLSTAAVSGAEWSFVITTPRTPKNAAVRKIAPTFCGSCR